MKALVLIQTEKQDPILKALSELGAVPVSAAGKIDYLAKLSDVLDSDAGDIAKQIKELQAKKKQIEKAAETLSNYIKAEMSEEGLCSIEGEQFKFNLSSSQGKLVVDESLIPDELFTVETIRSPNTKLIKAMIEAGQLVEGCTIDSGHRLTIKAKKED